MSLARKWSMVLWAALAALAGHGEEARANVLYDVTVNYTDWISFDAAYSFTMEFAAVPTTLNPVVSPASLVGGDFTGERLVVNSSPWFLAVDGAVTQLSFDGTTLSFVALDEFDTGLFYTPRVFRPGSDLAYVDDGLTVSPLGVTGLTVSRRADVPAPSSVALVAAALLPVGWRVAARRPGRRASGSVRP